MKIIDISNDNNENNVDEDNQQQQGMCFFEIFFGFPIFFFKQNYLKNSFYHYLFYISWHTCQQQN